MTNLLTNVLVLASLHSIPTNTPAFQNYAFRTMLTNAAYLSRQWHLDIPQPIDTIMVTRYKALPQPEGIWGYIFLNNRYLFRFSGGNFVEFDDARLPSFFSSEDAQQELAALKQRMGKTNLLTIEKAQDIAESVFKSLGKVEGTNSSKPSVQQQMRYHGSDATYQLPYYEFVWNKSRKAILRVEISGISSNVISIETSSPSYKIPKPTNYLEMLGLPTNTVFVVRRPPPPPLPPRYEIYGQ